MLSSVIAMPFRSAPHMPRHAQRHGIDTGLVEIDRVTIVFGKGRKAHKAIEETSIRVEPGEFVCILGPSGCGKSTLINTVAGYVKPNSGEVRVDGDPVTAPGPDRGMVFQQYSLFPWKTVKDNVAFGPRMAGQSYVTAEAVARTFLDMVGLARFANRYPAELSGGMQQRVGIARALANYPRVLLMDEPFGALDAQTRVMMQENLLNIWSEFGTTVLFITHDIDEAIFLADRVLIMSAGPGRIIADLAVNLPRPRAPEVTAEPAFAELKRQCIASIRAESLKAFEQDKSLRREPVTVPRMQVGLAAALAAALLSVGYSRGDQLDMTGVEPQDVCGECHGLDGAGNHIKFPRIAGQKQSYIIKQLLDFRAGRRKNDGGQMQKTATELDEADIPRVAEWFAAQLPPWPKVTIEVDPDLVRARQMALSGIDGIPACLSCHSASSLRLLDRPFDAPRLAGQRDYYIAKELTDFREGRRGNDPEQTMSKIARRLSDTDILSVSVFLSQNPDLHEATPP